MKRTGFFYTVICAALIPLAAATLVSCGEKKSAQTETVEEEKAVTVNTQKVSRSSLSDYIEFGGSIRARNSVEIYSTVAGKITRIHVKSGDRIYANQIIAEVDPSRPGAVYSASPVRSSIAGTVVSLPATVGAQVSTSSVLATVGQIENLEIFIEVPERFSSLLHTKQDALVSVPTCPGETFAATVTEVSPVIDAVSRSVQVVLTLTDSDPRIKAGMSARVHLITGTLENIITVPSKSIMSDSGETFVYVAKSDGAKVRAEKRTVITGLTVDGRTEIKEGLAEGDALIIKGQTLIGGGQLLNAVETAQ